MSDARRQPWYNIAFGAHYPRLYAHRDLQEARRCLALLPRLAPLGGGSVLDLGCGHGRHLELLAAAGSPALGLDLSRPLLHEAQRRAPGAPLLQADMRQLPLRDGVCGAVLSLFTAFGYFGTAANHLPVVREIARVLRSDGCWYLDFLDSDRVAKELAGGVRRSTRRLGPLLVQEERRLATAPLRVVKDVQLSAVSGREAEARALGVAAEGLRYAEEVTLLSLDELAELAAAAGLRRIAAAGDYAGSPLVPGASERWLLVFARGGRKGDGA